MAKNKGGREAKKPKANAKKPGGAVSSAVTPVDAINPVKPKR